MKTETLIRIARDNPDLFCCLRCAKLHPLADIKHPASTERDWRHPCLDIAREHLEDITQPLRMLFGSHWAGGQYDFRHCHLVAAVKNHCHGGTLGVTAEALGYTQVTTSRTCVRDTEVTELFSIQGLVCSRSTSIDHLQTGEDAQATAMPALVLQIQNWMLFHNRPSMALVMGELRHMDICAHKIVSSAIQAGSLGVNGNLQLHSDGPTLVNQYCRACGVEFRVDLHGCGDDGKAVVVTKWVDLGAGLDIDDVKWRRALSYSRQRHQVTATPRDVARPLRDVSRHDSGDSDPTERNRSFLKGQEYQRLLHARTGGFYFTSVPYHWRAQ
ncbi:hypothetical protein BDW74DRAFT_151540 [Aspergillus multicolor]|uniref:uncharacterized protein n=1 Tax=Aspergillus multicolor TaxID=41759 RepID=UPI003CCDA935